MTRVLILGLAILVSPASFAQETVEIATNASPSSAGSSDLWQQAKKLSWNKTLLVDDANLSRVPKISSTSFAKLQKAGTTGLLSHWVFKVEAIVNDATMVIQTGKTDILLDGYSTSQVKVGDNVVIMDYVRSSGLKKTTLPNGESRRLIEAKALTPWETVTHEEELQKTGFSWYTLTSGERLLAKWSRLHNTNMTLALTLTSGSYRYFKLDEFTQESLSLLKEQSERLGTKLPATDTAVAEGVEDRSIPGMSPAPLYNALTEQGYSVTSIEPRTNSCEVIWEKDKGRYHLEVHESYGSVWVVSLIIYKNKKPGEPAFPPEDLEQMQLLAATKFDGADVDAAVRWVAENFERVGKLPCGQAMLEINASDAVRILSIYRNLDRQP